MEATMLRQLAEIQDMPYPALKEKWRSLYGTEPPAYTRQHMVRRLAYRVQELAYGGLSDETKAELERIAEEDERQRQGARAERRKPKDTHPLAGKNRIRVILRSPDVIARTFREVQVQAGGERAELAGQQERLEARLAELKRMIRDLVQAGGNDGALGAELAKLNEEYSQAQNRLEDVAHAMEALGCGGPTEDEVREGLQKLDPVWDELFPAEKERIVKLLVEEVVVSKTGLLIRLRLHGLNSLVAELQAEGPGGAVGPVGSDGPVEGAGGHMEPGKDSQTVDIHVPMQFKTRSGRKEIISPGSPSGLPSGAETDPKAQPNRPLVLALARAHRWQRMLDSGEASSLDEIAKHRGVDRSYVGRIMKLASLAPGIVQMLLTGEEPSNTSLNALAKDMPLEWDRHPPLRPARIAFPRRSLKVSPRPRPSG